ncbi:hypothetical protein L1987_34986 [Smallanthus sonchifolius]|uniref:Uncharacterized protein n=1 Tax=Smallanthus sonchifolius TaxID=185202 RepID=A0ACB9HV32_9ASTR|nr:hypothetical protein L1987_34986 [Smallanthus sonchifolius]
MVSSSKTQPRLITQLQGQSPFPPFAGAPPSSSLSPPSRSSDHRHLRIVFRISNSNSICMFISFELWDSLMDCLFLKIRSI